MNLTLPEPPSSNRYWRVGNGVVYKTDKARKYQQTVRLAALAQKYPGPLHGDVKLTLKWYRKRRAGDLSNRVKVAEDALQGVCYLDDKQVVELHVYRYDDKVNPRLEVTCVEADRAG